MRYVAAYLLAVLAGNQSPDAAAIEKILSSVGVKVEKDRATKVISELKGKSLEQLIADGNKKLASVPAAPAGGAVAAAPAAAAGGAAKKDEPSNFNLTIYLLLLKPTYSLYCMSCVCVFLLCLSQVKMPVLGHARLEYTPRI